MSHNSNTHNSNTHNNNTHNSNTHCLNESLGLQSIQIGLHCLIDSVE